MTCYIGVDLGGTHLRAALVNLDTGAIVAQRKAGTPAREGPPAVIAALAEAVEEVISAAGIPRPDIGGIGIGIPGRVDQARGRALLLPNVAGDWPAVPLAGLLAERLGMGARLINDVRAITLGEWMYGAGRGVDTLACYAIGTGIGGGVVVGGRLHLGIGGAAGELGHQVVELNGLPCNCGGRGCLELYASGPSIMAQAIRAVVLRRPTRMAEMVNGDISRLSVAVAIQAAREGDAEAQAIFERAGAYVGMAVSNTVLTLSPRRVIFGGGVAAAGDLLLDPVRRTLRERVHLAPADQVEIMPAALGDQGGLLGAAVWAATASVDSN